MKQYSVLSVGNRVMRAATGARKTGVLVDTAVNSLTNVVVLMLAARLLDAESLASFSIFQLVVSSIVGLQRATIVYPTLATQRTLGEHEIPRSWLLNVTVPLALALSPLIAFLARGKVETLWVALAALTSLALLAQDLLRYRLFMRERAGNAVAGDAVGLVVLLVCVTPSIFGVVRGPASFAAEWAVSGLATWLLFSVFDRGPASKPPASLRSTLELGRWSALDTALSAAAAMAPLFASAFVLHSDVAGTYRLFQAAQGPLNILSTSMVAIVGLDSWKLTTDASLLTFKKQIHRLSIVMSAGAVLYIAIAIAGISLASGIHVEGRERPIVIIAIASVIGAATIPISSACLTLGRQRAGALLRISVTIVSTLLVVAAVEGFWIPWGDPVGTLMLFSSFVNFVGWGLVFRFATGQAKQRQRSGTS